MPNMCRRETRGRIATIEWKNKRYPTDLTDPGWALISSVLFLPAKRGRPPNVDLHEVLNMIRHITRSDGNWHMLSKDFPTWQTVYWWFRCFVRLMLCQTVHYNALMMDREWVGREVSPSGGVLDSQTVKAPAPKVQRGLNGAKKTVDRERLLVVDTDRLPLMGNITSADNKGQLRGADDPGLHPQALAVAQEPLCQWCLRSNPIHQQCCFPGLRHRGGAPYRQGARVLGGAAALCFRAHLRLAFALALSGTRLRTAHQRFQDHDACPHGKRAVA